MSKEVRTVESLRALGEEIASLTSTEQVEFLRGFIARHDFLANEIHQETRGREDSRPRIHDKVARLLGQVRDNLLQLPS
jgi:hypothetical protein